MAQPALARVKQGINTKTFKPFWYVEVRQTARTCWCLLHSKGKWLRHRTRPAADKTAKDMERRLRARGQLH